MAFHTIPEQTNDTDCWKSILQNVRNSGGEWLRLKAFLGLQSMNQSTLYIVNNMAVDGLGRMGGLVQKCEQTLKLNSVWNINVV